RHVVPPAQAGQRAYPKPYAGHAGIVVRICTDGAVLRHTHGHLYRAQAQGLLVAQLHDAVADRHIATDLPDRYFDDSFLWRDAAMAAQLWPGRGRATGLVVYRLSDQKRMAVANYAGLYPGAVPDDADHAAGAGRDAGSDANRLHQVCPRARPARTH